MPIDYDGDGVYDGYETKEGETYSSFSSSQASGWDRKIIVGKDNGAWASINYDYSLSSNQEYIFEKQYLASQEASLKTMTTAFVVCILIAVALVVILILVLVKTVKKGKQEYENEQQKQKAEIEEAEAKANEAKRRAEQVSRTCAYCGSKVPDGEEKCPSCGSSKFE